MAQYRVLNDAIGAAKQVEKEITSFGRQLLETSQTIFENINAIDEWEKYRDEILLEIRNAFPEMLFKRDSLNVQHVSTHEFDNFKVENVLFNSILGWQVNASVYIPKGKGPFPAVICPTGHSSKFRENYYIPAQIFASNGYIAVSFCPPGCVGELDKGNDHFVNGYSGWLTGMWSQTYFVADALACVDYVYSLDYCDTSKKVFITGTSGGGTTSMYAAVLDDRISFLAPVCCVTDYVNATYKDLYTTCPETIGKGFAREGIDTVILLSLFAPQKMLVIAGEKDEVYDSQITQNIVDQVKCVYKLYNKPENIEIYIEKDSGHRYSPKMAIETLKRMNTIRGESDKPIIYNEQAIVHLKREQLSCYPSLSVNMHTINRDESIQLKAQRTKLTISETKGIIRNLLDIDALQTRAKYTYKEPLCNVHSRWCHKFQETILTHSENCKIPLMHAFREDMQERPLFLWFGEKGVWSEFNKKGPLTKAIGFLERTAIANEHSVMAADITGLGELEMQHTTYDAASWNRIERILTYLSVFNDRPIMAYRVRDILITINHAKKYAKNISIGGYGIGAISCILAGLIAKDEISKVIAVRPLAAYSLIAQEPSFEWSESILVPDILKFTDIPEILECLGEKAVCINPLNAYMQILDEKLSRNLYKEAIGNSVKIIYDNDWENALVKEILRDSLPK